MNLIPSSKWQQFKQAKLGYYSLILFTIIILFCILAELFINNRALIVHYEGKLYFPTYNAIYPGTTFGLPYQHETNYRELQQKFKQQHNNNWVLLPIIPYNPYEIDSKLTKYPPTSPNLKQRHVLGTDSVGRDILARLIYGLRTAISFSAILVLCNYIIGITVGCLMGYLGGWFDLTLQRAIEILSNIPFLYLIMILSSLVIPNFWWLLTIMITFGWMSITWYMRTITYRERHKEYILAAKTLGASTKYIITKHILPHTTSIIITFIPFSITAGITILTALDYLGFGLPAPTPSWGELLKQGKNHLESPWIVSSVIFALIILLTMITFIGEAIRETLDPKKLTKYK